MWQRMKEEAAAKLPSKDQNDGDRERLRSRGVGGRGIMKGREMQGRREGEKEGEKERVSPSRLGALCDCPT
jgi:hypothetical protein